MADERIEKTVRVDRFRWIRYPCCFIAIITLVIVIYGEATEPGSPYVKDHEPSGKRFDHLTFTNGSDQTVTGLEFSITDKNGGLYLPPTSVIPSTLPSIAPGQTVSYVFNEDFGNAMTAVTAKVTWGEAEEAVTKTCTIEVVDWGINAAKFWLGMPGLGTSGYRIAGEALICDDPDAPNPNRKVIPHETSTP